MSAPGGAAPEREALRDLLLCLILPPLLAVLLGWRPGALLGGNDLPLLYLPLYQRLLAVGGDFSAFLYDPAWLGGAKLRDIFGALPLLAALARLGVAPITALNLLVLLTQALYAFTGLRLALAAAALLAEREVAGPPQVPVPARLALATVLACAPVLAWRLSFGHLTIALAALPPVVACALVLSHAAGQASRTLTLISILALWHALPQVGAQSLLNGLVFGAPLALALLFTLVPRGRRLAALAALPLPITAAALLSLPPLWGILQHLHSGDSSRAPSQTVFTYLYLKATGADWLASLPWALAPELPGLQQRPPMEWHETNYPIGPLLPLTALLLPRRRRPLLLIIGLSAVLLLCFSADVQPVSTALLRLIPPLRMFRVPARAALPFLLLLTPVVLAPLLRLDLRPRRRDLALLLVAALLFISDGLVREALLWLGVIAALLPAARPAWGPAAPSAIAGLGLLALGAALAQRDRLPPLDMGQATLDVGPQRIAAAAPTLSPPLTRLFLDPQRPVAIGLNDALRADRATLDGYGIPLERFLRLHSALTEQPYNPTLAAVHIPPESPASPVFADLYNITAIARIGLRSERIPRTGQVDRPAWFSHHVYSVSDWAALGAALRQTNDRHGPLFLLATERRGLPLADVALAGCEAAQIQVEHAGRGALLLRARVRSPTLCPLVVASNYASMLHADGHTADGARRPLRTFPANGALLGVLVPPDITQVSVQVRETPPWWVDRSPWPGAALLLAALLRPQRRRPRRSATTP